MKRKVEIHVLKVERVFFRECITPRAEACQEVACPDVRTNVRKIVGKHFAMFKQ